MIDIHHRVGVESPSTEGVYDALTTIDGLAGWWTTDTTGDPSLGGKLEFRFLPGGFDMEVIDLVRGHPYPLALGAHIHAAERIAFQTGGGQTRFEQSAAIVGPSRIGRTVFRSGFTVYTVRNGTIDAGRFVPLDPEAQDARR